MFPKAIANKQPKQSLPRILTAIALGVIIVILSSMISATYYVPTTTTFGKSVVARKTTYGIPFSFYSYISNETYNGPEGTTQYPTIGVITLEKLLTTVFNAQSSKNELDLERTKYMMTDEATSSSLYIQPLVILINVALWSALWYFTARYLIPKIKTTQVKKQTQNSANKSKL